MNPATQTLLAESVTCPKCGGKIPEPFARFGTPVAYTHSRGKIGNRPCRARLIVHPAKGTAELVPYMTSLESALERALGGEG